LLIRQWVTTSRGEIGKQRAWPDFPLHLNPDFFSSKLYRKHFRALLFPAAGAIIKADMPAVPAADDLTVLDNSFT
jgi:hypothetical protein